MADEEDAQKAVQEETLTDYLKRRNLVPPTHYTSKIWKYFGFKVDDKDKKYVFCGLCGAKLEYCRNTTNMGTHLKGVHPLFYAKSELQKKSTDEASSSKSRTADGNEGTPEDESQRTLEDSFPATTTMPASSRRAKDITNAIGYFVAKDMMPISTTGGVGFKRLIRVLEPRYVIPHRKTFTDKTIPAMYNSLRNDCVGPLVSSATSFALTTDCWTSRATQSFIGVTIHLITDNFQMKSFALANKELPVSHNAENLAAALEKVLEECGLLHNNVVSVTTDNAANIDNAVCDVLSWPHLGCFGHTLNLAVKAGLKIGQVKGAVARCSRLVTYFHKSSRATYLLEVKQQALGLPSHSLLQDVETRWNSTLDMIERVLEQQSAICATLIDQKRLDLMPQDSEFKILEGVATIIKPFRRITSQVSGEEYVTVSAVKPLLHYLINTLKEDQSSSDTSTKTTTLGNTRAGASNCVADVTKSARKAILDNLSTRYQGSLVNMLLCSASFMDPRFKSLPFVSVDYKKEIHTNVNQQAIDLMRSSKRNLESSNKEVSGSGTGPPRKKRKHPNETWSVILGPMFKKESEDTCGTSTDDQVDKEFQKYLAEDLILIDDNPLKWWRDNQLRYPVLSKIAQQLLCIPATSVPCERLFSTSGNIITPKRASLDPNNASMLCFLAQNLPDK
ncbi:E3 SUMO-protein ligase ZBED1-like [Dysidea avara]|uniref:E3 SUMO-protein ligase ZBED1-like n=1 Tax=Dysidea avara TaxID=196820 RepID=UPI003329310A